MGEERNAMYMTPEQIIKRWGITYVDSTFGGVNLHLQ